MRRSTIFSMLAVALVAGGIQFSTPMRAQETDKPKVNRQSIEAIMQAKLTNTHRVLSGLVDADFDQIADAARVLKLTSLKSPKLQSGDEMNDRVFEHFETEFLRLSAKVEEMAQQKNLEGAAFEYQNLTATCIACHQHVRNAARPIKVHTKTNSDGKASSGM